MSSIVHSFPSFTLDENEIDFSYLAPFIHVLKGQGKNGADIRVRVSFQSHVFSKTPENDEFDFQDEGGRERTFCLDRFEASKSLPSICQRMLADNFYTWESKDRNRVSNMAVIDDKRETGSHYVVLYYLFPSKSGQIDVEMVIKSAYQKDINFDHIKRYFKVIQLVKTCYFKGEKVPK